MRQLCPNDAVFLSFETSETPGHIGGLAILDPTTLPPVTSHSPVSPVSSEEGSSDSTTSPEPAADLDFDRFRSFVAERVGLCKRFGWRIQEVPLGLDLPYWVEDETFRVEDQVMRVAVPAPGGPREFAELTNLLFAKPLDRDRPLWEMFFIEGLAGGRKAMLWKVHHCLMDGVSGAGLAELLFDLAPEPADRPLVPTGNEPSPGGPADWAEMTWQSLRNAAQRPFSFAQHLGKGLAALRPESVSKTVPRVGFNGVVGPRRAVAWTQVSLDEVKRVKSRHGVTVNDVVLAITGGAVRRYLAEHETVPELPLYAIVPVSTRATGETEVGNRVSEITLPWGTDIADPVERLQSVHREGRRAKQESCQTGASLMEAMGEAVVPGVLRVITRIAAMAPDAVPLPGNAVVSNVRGLDVPLYIAGARVDSMVPISLLAPGQGLNITAVSYDGMLHFGITVDPDLVPEPWMIADGIAKALTELEASF